MVFAEADNYKVLKAAEQVKDEGIAKPILLGDKKKIAELIEEYNLELQDVPIVDPRKSRRTNDTRSEIHYGKKEKEKDIPFLNPAKLCRSVIILVE